MKKVFEHFNIDEETKSIYKYSPVYITQYKSQKVIVKKTKRHEDRMLNLFKWENLLIDSGVKVVAPINYEGEYYFKDEDLHWVMYPFIEGRLYNGSMEDIRKAGQLLGQIHSVSSSTEYTFEHGFHWFDYEDEFIEEVEEDFAAINKNFPDIIKMEKHKELFDSLKELVNTKFRGLKSLRVPYVDGVWDYKANNLVYVGNDPVLIDPDNSGFIPRVFDLALALILFHTEINGIQAKTFDVDQWNEFLKGYLKYVTLTKQELKVWHEFTRFVYVDEALWAINELEDHESDRQKEFMKSLLLFEPSIYKLKKTED